MPLILPASTGFAALFLSDFLRLRVSAAAGPVSAAGYVLVAASVAGFAAAGLREWSFFSLSAFAGAAVSVVFGALLVYSVFIEIPAAKKRLGLAADVAVSSGTYGFSRHPGFLWFAGLMAGLVLFRGGEGAAFAAFVTALDFLLVAVQDAFFFPRFFVNYGDYKSRVPFLLGPGGGGADGHR